MKFLGNYNNKVPPPTRPEVESAVEAYLQKGGTIKKVVPTLGFTSGLTEALAEWEENPLPNRTRRKET